MAGILERQNSKVKKAVRDVAKLVQQKHIKTYLVGGIVRDGILRRENLDLDIVVEGNALRLARAVAKKWATEIQEYGKFQTARVQGRDGLRVDFAMARKEAYQHSGALPDVRPGTMHDDLFRRDFTINALAVSLNREDFGQVLDYYGGLKDLKFKKIRVLHDNSFQDDPTRLLRAVRFEQRFSFAMERGTLKLFKEAVRKNVVKNVKASRYFAEFRKLLKEEKPKRCLQRLAGLKALDFIRPRYTLNSRRLGVIGGNAGKLNKLNKDALTDMSLIYLMAMIEAENESQIKIWSEKFHLTRAEREALLSLKKIPQLLAQLDKGRLSNTRIYETLNGLPRVLLSYVWLTTGKKTVRKHIGTYFKRLEGTTIHIRGSDLRRMGVHKGRVIGRLLHQILLRKLEGKVRTYRDEKRLAKQLVGSF